MRDVEKLAYLRDALKDGSAKLVIQGLLQAAGNYAEAIKCLQERYDRPRLIHQAHVRAILEAPPLKDDSTKVLRRLHDTLNQHLRALKAMEHNCFDTFITAAAELKFNQLATCKWQKFSRDCDSISPYSALLKFLDLEARGAENTVGDGERRRPVVTSGKKPLQSLLMRSISTIPVWVVRRPNIHATHAKRSKGYRANVKMGIVRDNTFCLNCLGSGHFLKESPSGQRCKNATSHIIHGCMSILKARIARHLRRARTLENFRTL